MSSLTKLLFVDRHRRDMADQGGLKTPMIMSYPVSGDFEEACISLRSGDFHMVRVAPQRETRTGFFDLDFDDEEAQHADLIDFLYDHGSKRQWGGVAEIALPDETLLDTVATYLKSYDLEPQHGFVGLVGFAALVTADLIDLPEKVDSISDITSDLLNEWMAEHLHVGKVGEVPVYFNPHMSEHIVFSGEPKSVGLMTRVGDFASILVHNAERSMIILRVGLNDHDDVPEPDLDSSTETRAEEPSD
jgi:hypothetical protein